LKTRTLWLDILKTSVEIKSTETHKSAARAFARPVNAFSEVLTQQTDKTDRSSANHAGPLARAALLELFKKERERQSFFRSCCEISTHRLTSQTRQFCGELSDRGHRFQTEEVEDALLGLVRDLLPESAAAQWDAEWAHPLCKHAIARLAEHYTVLSAEEKDALDLSGQDLWNERMVTAGLDNNPAAFRAALKGWEKAGLEAIERVRVSEGGAA
jgi:hypothetical protein